MKKRPFYFDSSTEFGTVFYRRFNLRHQLIERMLLRNPVEDLPAGFWTVTLKWHRSIIPGLFFKQVH